jgi:hypothetical protein
MKSYDYDAVTYDGVVYCTECLPEGISSESEECFPVFADSEWDYYPVCDACGQVHDYVSLTAYGEKYEREQRIKIDARENPAKYHAEKFLTDLKEPFAWPGVYQRTFTMADGEPLCYECAEKEKNLIIDAIIDGNDDQWQVIGCEIYYEGPDFECCNCGKIMQTVYGDPEKE